MPIRMSQHASMLAILLLAASLITPANAEDQFAIDAKGFVTDALGEPISDATVALIRFQADATPGEMRDTRAIQTTTTGPDGRFHLVQDGLAGRICLCAV